MATLRDIAELEAEILAAGLRGITKQQILEALTSLSDVQGILNISNAPADPLDPQAVNVPLSGPYQNFDQWERTRDTKGVQEGPTVGVAPFEYYEIRNGGSGNWNAMARLKGSCDTAGTVRIRLMLVEGGTVENSQPYNDKEVVVADGKFDLEFHAMIKNVAVGDRLLMQVRGPNGGVITLEEGHFWVKRG